jgi:hypothetical protein
MKRALIAANRAKEHRNMNPNRVLQDLLVAFLKDDRQGALKAMTSLTAHLVRGGAMPEALMALAPVTARTDIPLPVNAEQLAIFQLAMGMKADGEPIEVIKAAVDAFCEPYTGPVN